jgi:glycosyltransferase involved in cell wall biosynthesis
MTTDHTPPLFSGIVVTFNDAHHLADCLRGMAFCDELIVIDLGSTDGSPEIAQEFEAIIHMHSWVPIVESIRQWAVSLASHDWVVFMDPDEVLPPGIDSPIREMIHTDPRLGAIGLPMLFYFKGKPLNTTAWGGLKHKARVLHRYRNHFSTMVHNNHQVLDGYNYAILNLSSPDAVILHYWIDSWGELFQKHWRYIKLEGEARYQAGIRFSVRLLLRDLYKKLVYNLIARRGLWGGLTGIFLSFFNVWYALMSWLSLRRYQYHLHVSRTEPEV